MKRFSVMILLFIVALLSVGLTSCEDDNAKYVKNGDGEHISVSNLEQVAVKNENFLESEVSWYDDEYNYYVYEVGVIENVPLTSVYTVIPYKTGEFTYEREVVKTTQESIETSTATAVTRSVTTTNAYSKTVDLELKSELAKTLTANVKRGYTFSTTKTEQEQDVWEQTYTSCVSTSNSEKNKITIEFNSSCKPGNYLYLHLGDVAVYYVVIQSRDDSDDTCYVDVYNKILNNKYVLHYAGESKNYPINKEEKINIDLSFIEDLAEPSTYIESKKPEIVLEDIKESFSYADSFKLNRLFGDSQTPIIGTNWSGFSEAYAKGYDKIEIEYKFWASSSESLIDGTANIYGYILTGGTLDSAVHSFEHETLENGSEISGKFVCDLRWLKKNDYLGIIFYIENYTETCVVNKISVSFRIYDSTK